MGNSRALSSSISILAMMTVERESQVVPTPTTPSPSSLFKLRTDTHTRSFIIATRLGGVV